MQRNRLGGSRYLKKLLKDKSLGKSDFLLSSSNCMPRERRSVAYYQLQPLSGGFLCNQAKCSTMKKTNTRKKTSRVFTDRQNTLKSVPASRAKEFNLSRRHSIDIKLKQSSVEDQTKIYQMYELYDENEGYESPIVLSKPKYS